MTESNRVSFDFRDFFAFGGGETLRAFVLFGFLVSALIAIGSHVAFRELSINVLRERLDLGRLEAERIAAEVEILGDKIGRAHV